MASDDIRVINNGFSTRTNARSGRQRTTVEVKAEPIVVDLNAQRLAKPVAMSIAEVLRERLSQIGQRASEATIKARESAARAFAGIQERKQANAAKKAQAAKAPTAPKVNHPKMPQKFGPARKPTSTGGVFKRYSGGRIGAMPPNQSDKLFHDSGRLIKSIVTQLAKAGTTSAEFVVNVAANRFDPQTLNPGNDGSPEAALVRVITRLRELVPEFGDAAKLMSDLRVRGAVRDVLANMIQVQSARISELKEERARAVLSLLRSVA